MPRRNYPKKRKPTLQLASSTPHLTTTYIACREKRRFPTEKQATYDAETRMLMQPSLELKVYHCNICQGWHLTNYKAKAK